MVLSVLTICEPLASHTEVNCREMCPRLSGLDFADEAEDAHQLHVDILVGSDHYWDLTTGRVQEGLIDLWRSTQGLVGFSLDRYPSQVRLISLTAL